jgi:hypothetical protein
MRPTQIFKKSEASWEMAKIVAILFWLPIAALIILSLFWF